MAEIKILLLKILHRNIDIWHEPKYKLGPDDTMGGK